MTGAGSGIGSDGNAFDGDGLNRFYPGVPYGPNDFNGPNECPTANLEIEDYTDSLQV